MEQNSFRASCLSIAAVKRKLFPMFSTLFPLTDFQMNAIEQSLDFIDSLIVTFYLLILRLTLTLSVSFPFSHYNEQTIFIFRLQMEMEMDIEENCVMSNIMLHLLFQ